jgi:broad specificity phosphatase PhoE
MGVERVYLVRHGETDYNVAGRWQGHLQTMLTDTGREQARALARHLRDFHLDAIYTSDLSRAADTAMLIAEGRNIAVHQDTRLREICLGLFQGLTRAQIQGTYPFEYGCWHSDNTYCVPQGESRMQLQARMVAFITEMATQETGKDVLLVTHGGSIKWLLMALFPPEVSSGKGIENTSVTTIARDAAGWQMVEFAALPHLRR